MLNTLQAQVDPKHTAVILVDVQNDFCAVGGALDRRGMDVSAAAEMVPRLANFIEEARGAGARIIWVKMVHQDSTDAPSWLFRKALSIGGPLPACMPDTWGVEYFQVKPAPGEIEVIKHRYSAFIGTNLDLILRSLEVKTIIMTGVATNVCVESTARDGFMTGYYMVFLDDCTASFKREWHEATLDNMANFFGIVTSSTEVAKIWQGRRLNQG